MTELLLEAGTEEIPAGYIGPALEWMRVAFERALDEAGLAGPSLTVTGHATPRRITLHATDLLESRPAVHGSKEGPRKEACFDDGGAPTKALEGFARGAGVAVDEVGFQESQKGKGRGLVAHVEVIVPGVDAAEVVPEIVRRVLHGVTFPKSMRWAGRDFTFCRPVRSLVIALGSRILEMTVGDVVSSAEIQGHPFLASDGFTISSASLDEYRAALLARKVVLDVAARKEIITRAIEATGLAVDLDQELLDEVANLVEWPGVAVGEFDPVFLELPDEVIIEPMKVQQRYFPVHEGQGPGLANRFVVVHNRGADGSGVIVEGNARVLRARLADAKFFYENDRQRPLESLLPRLDGVLFRQGQGSMGQRARRLEELAGAIAGQLDPDPQVASHARRAGLLAKADLVTEMVYEFPALQGIMGGIYAAEQEEHASVSEAMGLHYGPRQEDPVPDDVVSVALCLADKLDSLVAATRDKGLARGSRDPFATRRDAISATRILFEGGHDLSVGWLLDRAAEGYARDDEVAWDDDAKTTLLAFLQDRLLGFLKDTGHDHEHVAAVLDTDADSIAGVRCRLEALDQIAGIDCWADLVEAVERTWNITRAWTGSATVQPALMSEPEEVALWMAYEGMEGEFRALVESGSLVEASRLYATRLAAPLGAFFDKVYVNAEDPALRDNRMSILRTIHELYASRIANLARVNLKRDKRQRI